MSQWRQGLINKNIVVLLLETNLKRDKKIKFIFQIVYEVTHLYLTENDYQYYVKLRLMCQL